MPDQVVRALIPGVRAVAVVSTELTEEANRRHKCWPVAAAALGRAMNAALLIAETMKGNEGLTLRVAGDGPIGEVTADVHRRHCVRGYVRNPQVDLAPANGKLDVGTAVGNGMLHVSRFMENGEIFTGSVELASGEIGDDVTKYLLESEQVPSTVGVGVLVGTDGSVLGSAGFLIQAMPDAEEAILIELERNLQFVPSPSQLAYEGMTATGIIRLLFTGFEPTIFEPESVSFCCTCGKDRVKAVLASLGTDEIESMKAEGQAEVVCNFCNERYEFDTSDLERMLENR